MTPADIIAMIQLARGLLELANKIKTDLDQKGELTDAERAAFDKEMEDAFAQTYWKPEPGPEQ